MAIIYNADNPKASQFVFYCEECKEYAGTSELELICAHGHFFLHYDDDDYMVIVRRVDVKQRRYIRLSEPEKYKLVAEVPRLRK